jgi:pimeloyl-ACP methyl ester carboxylesterase
MLYNINMNKKYLRIILAIVLTILVVLAIGPFLIPIPPLEDTVDRHELADSDSRFVDVDGLEVHYKLAGEGKPVLVLLHGFGANAFSWTKVIEPLAEHGTVIAYDRPAFGLTERPLSWEGENPYSPKSQIDIVIGLLDALEIDQAILVGHSAGGTIATATTLESPGRVDALILVDAAIYTGGGSPVWIQPLLSTPQMERIGPLIARSFVKRGEQFLRQAYHDPDAITEEIMEGNRKTYRVNHWDVAFWELVAASHPLNLPDRIDQLDLPTLVVSGENDNIVPLADSQRLAREIPNAQLSIFPACGHVPQQECSQDFLQAVINFLHREEFTESE